MTASSSQWIRKVSLIVVEGEAGLDLSNMHINFEVYNSDDESPNSARIRVYNLKPETVARVKGEFSRVILQAGYENGNFGVIFDGTIKQVRSGKEKNTDSYVEIMASHYDIPYTFGVVNQTLAAGSTIMDRYLTIAKQTGGMPDKSVVAEQTGGVLPRGKVLWGLSKARMRDLADSIGCRWSIQNGVLKMIPLTGYLPGEAVVLNSQTGLIGAPESNDGGINVRCLLNPSIEIGCRVQIDNKDITATQNKDVVLYNTRNAISYQARKRNDGVYRVLVAEFVGDTRGQEWYSDLICIDIDPSAPPSESVKAA